MMAPYEVTHPGGSVEHWNEESGAVWLERMKNHFPKMVWLNPEPPAFWNSGDSEMQRLGACCDRVEPCRSLRHLERVVSEIARTAV